MNVYPDASYLLSLLINDALTARAKAFLHREKPLLLVSDFAAAEFASATGRGVRMGLLAKNEARAVLATFDVWTARFCTRIQLASADISAADAFLRLDLTLRTPDAMHIAASQRLGTSLATFDKKMSAAAARLGTVLAAV